ncbi:Glycosyl transferases group 1 [Quadrisphaera granulorum]|uniref:Glycosyl transferase family 1 n=1 Tax=Quadrisphaera granulorum TaxID=317664 RepID=A0A315ZSD0_9ACTN|nr:glycosyltransferase [Quadrisphaera granulorum]PWJ48471.1 glycosyl transferase family 1 [Quadrisphaera granulorum]SZE98430.1 Glycosyl transferases group 1 [Quadrisphaera granulorum]
MTGMSKPDRRLVILVRADPVICGHSGEARNLAEAALLRGFDDVRILTWPLEALQAAGLPLKPLDALLPYSPGITVERPAPVGDNRVPDGRYIAGLTGRLVELLAEGVPTVVLSMYLTPHTDVVVQAVAGARVAGFALDARTLAKAVGSDITNVVSNALRTGAWGAAAMVLSTYLQNDDLLAVSEFTKEEVVRWAEQVDALAGTRFAEELTARVRISYPPIDTSAFLDLDPAAVDAALAARGLERDGYVLFLSRITRAKGVDDLINAYRASRTSATKKLVIAGAGNAVEAVRAQIAEVPGDDERILLLTDVSDAEKPLLMRGCAAYALPTKPVPEFVETFGIALTEKMLAGGGPVITTLVGGTGEAVGDTALIIEAGDVAGLARMIDRAVLDMGEIERLELEQRAREHALRFDKLRVFDEMLPPTETVVEEQHRVVDTPREGAPL